MIVQMDLWSTGFRFASFFDPAIITATGRQVDSNFPFIGGGSNPDLSTMDNREGFEKVRLRCWIGCGTFLSIDTRK